MLKVELVYYDDLTEEEQECQPNNGNGKECANYVKVTEEGKTLAIMSDAVKPEDASYSRDFNEVISVIRLAYRKGIDRGKLIGGMNP